MYIIKQTPEDFVVKEITNLKPKDKGRFLYFKLKKKNRNTMDVVKQLTKYLNIKEKQIGFAGSKDKHAITEQVISIQGANKDKILRATIDNVELEFLGYGDEPITLGDLKGNYFEIVIRNVDPDIEKINFCENYFDEQRFSKNNKDVGKNIVKKNFKEALKLIDNPKSNEHLKQKPNDFIGALKKIPIRLLRMYVHAYQSYLWNEIVAGILEKETVVKKVSYSLGEYVFVKEKIGFKVPLIGFDEDIVSTEIKDIVDELMQKEELAYMDFIIKQIPELSLEGKLREVFIEIKDMEIEKLSDNEVKIKFTLPKGSYATMVIRKLFA